MSDLRTRLPAVKAWDEGTTEMEQACVPMWHLGCEAINVLEAEVERLRCCGNCWYWEPSLYECARVSVYDTQRTWSGDCDNLDRCHFTPTLWAARKELDQHPKTAVE